MVRKVSTVHLAADGSCLVGIERIEVKERAGSIREEVVSRISAVTCAHIRKDLNVLKGVDRLIEADTVCRKSYGKTLSISLVFKRHSEYRRVSIVRLVFSKNMVVLKLLVGVLGAVLQNDLLCLGELSLTCIGVKYVNGHCLNDRELLECSCILRVRADKIVVKTAVGILHILSVSLGNVKLIYGIYHKVREHFLHVEHLGIL